MVTCVFAVTPLTVTVEEAIMVIGVVMSCREALPADVPNEGESVAEREFVPGREEPVVESEFVLGTDKSVVGWGVVFAGGKLVVAGGAGPVPSGTDPVPNGTDPVPNRAVPYLFVLLETSY